MTGFALFAMLFGAGNLIFSPNVTLILAIGPLLALPRTGATAFEMIFSKGGSNYNMYKIIFIVVFFGVSLLFSLKSSKVVDRVGAILTPILLAVLAIIIFKGVFFPIGNSITTVKELAPFKYGF